MGTPFEGNSGGKTKRQPGIEVLRMLAMYLIVLGHYLYNYVKTSEAFSTFDVAQPAQALSYALTETTIVFTSMGVDLFVLITGFFLVEKPVFLGLGSDVCRASLINLSAAENMPVFGGDCTAVCGTGSRVYVGLANVIPKIFYSTEGHLEIPSTCPACGKPVRIIVHARKGLQDIKRVFCLNPDCPRTVHERPGEGRTGH